MRVQTLLWCPSALPFRVGLPASDAASLISDMLPLRPLAPVVPPAPAPLL